MKNRPEEYLVLNVNMLERLIKAARANRVTKKPKGSNTIILKVQQASRDYPGQLQYTPGFREKLAELVP